MQNAFGFNPFQQFEIDGQAEHGDVRERHAHVQSVRRRPNPPGPQSPSPANGSAEPPKPQAASTPAPAPEKDDAIDDLKRKLDELQGQLAELSKKSS